MLDLNAVMIFTRVVKSSSFSKAASELGVTKSTISKKISELETYLGATLLKRTTRSLQLTDMGRQFFDQASRGLSEIKEASDLAQASSLEPQGNLRITAPGDFAPSIVAPLLAGFLEKFPKVSVEMVLTDRLLDLVGDNIDVAMRVGKLSDSSLRARKVGRDVFKFLASPSYAKKMKDAKHPEDLKKYKCLLFAPKTELKKFQIRSGNSRYIYEPKPMFVANNILSVKSLVMEGSGVALLPVSTCREELQNKSLQIVLPDWALDDAPVHLVYQKHLFTPPKVQAFIAYMEPLLKPFFQSEFES
ncbi:MAG TPA: LysR substrate-binding domain-containing protein [Bdellovibrio sp.]|uniref:LysR family transcriptional regulator n=1 Tax=Bdellovibrio sp. TaxID=28201 RepID=UPI002EFDCF0C